MLDFEIPDSKEFFAQLLRNLTIFCRDQVIENDHLFVNVEDKTFMNRFNTSGVWFGELLKDLSNCNDLDLLLNNEEKLNQLKGLALYEFFIGNLFKELSMVLKDAKENAFPAQWDPKLGIHVT